MLKIFDPNSVSQPALKKERWYSLPKLNPGDPMYIADKQAKAWLCGFLVAWGIFAFIVFGHMIVYALSR